MPACRNLGPMRPSRPMPRATSTTSAPVSSHTLAISLMNEIFVAKNAFAASLIISALETSVRTSGAPSGAYSEQKARMLERRAELGGEVQPRGVAGDQLVQAGLVDRHLPRAQLLDLGGVDV